MLLSFDSKSINLLFSFQTLTKHHRKHFCSPHRFLLLTYYSAPFTTQKALSTNLKTPTYTPEKAPPIAHQLSFLHNSETLLPISVSPHYTPLQALTKHHRKQFCTPGRTLSVPYSRCPYTPQFNPSYSHKGALPPRPSALLHTSEWPPTDFREPSLHISESPSWNICVLSNHFKELSLLTLEVPPHPKSLHLYTLQCTLHIHLSEPVLIISGGPPTHIKESSDTPHGALLHMSQSRHYTAQRTLPTNLREWSVHNWACLPCASQRAIPTHLKVTSLHTSESTPYSP